jgi:hypothetical protein
MLIAFLARIYGPIQSNIVMWHTFPAHGMNCEVSRNSRCCGKVLQTRPLLGNNWVTGGDVYHAVLAIATWCNNRRTVGRDVFYAVRDEDTQGVDCTLWVNSAIGGQLVQLGSCRCSWKASVREDRSRWIWKPRTLHRWKPLPEDW